jgi:hypothetical protein
MDRGIRRAGNRTAAWGSAMFAAGSLLTCGSVRAEESGRSFEISGAVQGDFITDIEGRLDPAWDDAFRVSKICIDGACGTDGQSSLSVKQSRFGVEGSMPTGDSSPPFKFRFEFNLFGVGVDAGQTTFHLRYAYGEWGSWTVGQTYSLFMDGDVYPNTVDAWGPPGMVYFRNVQIRWTPFASDASHFAVAIERPSNDIDAGNLRLIEGLEGVQVQNDEEVPDVTAQYRFGGDWGHVQLSGILRRVGFEVRATSADPWRDGDERGWGLNLASAINTIGRDRLLLQVVYGEGIASYMNDGGMDLAPAVAFDEGGSVSDVEAQAVPLTGVMAYYDHYWSDRWSSSVGYSYTEVDNTNFQEPGSFHKGEYASGNLLYYPRENLLVGAELMWGQRENNDGASDDDFRLQLSVIYSFSTKL